MRRTLTLGLVLVSLAALALSQGGALSQSDIDRLLSNGVSPQRVSVLVEQQGLSFAPDGNYLRSLELRSNTDKLIEAVKAAGARYLKPRAEADLKAQRWPQAEQEYRALLELTPNDPAAHAGLGLALVRQGRADASLSEFGKALAADPNVAGGHGLVLEAPGSTLEKLNEEHGYVALAGGDDLELGQQVRIVPNHVCVVANLFEELIGVRNGSIESRWTVVRGR